MPSIFRLENNLSNKLYAFHGVCLGTPRVININRHDHRVSFTHHLGRNHIKCGVCRGNVSQYNGAYSCSVCPNYAVHSGCARRLDVWDGKELEGLFNSDYNEDIAPFKVVGDNLISHFSHDKHTLRLHKNDIIRDDERTRCEACHHPIGFESIYSCEECCFVLHEKCANLPLKKRLVFSYLRYELKSGEAAIVVDCNMCGVLSSGFRYTSPLLKDVDVHCASLSEPFFHDGHLHPLYFDKNMGHICDACKRNVDDCVLRCDVCDFDLCLYCASLPLKIWHRNNIQIIKLVRPSYTGSPDSISWIFTKDGNYSVKSGYHLCHQLSNSSPDISVAEGANSNMNKLYKDIWKWKVPPKLKHFWWRCINNSLPVADNLEKRRLRVDTTCYRCGNQSETTNHLLFQCPVSKEIWEIASQMKIKGDITISNSLMQNIFLLDEVRKSDTSNGDLLPFVGWRIWKDRNNLIFQNKRWNIPMIIQKAMEDKNLWMEAMQAEAVDLQQVRTCSQQDAEPFRIQNLLADPFKYICFVDGSWISNKQRAGIGWSLQDQKGRVILQGSTSIEPICSALEAEAEALKLALLEIKKLGYTYVVFAGDASLIYEILQKQQAGTTQSHAAGVQSLIQDIKNIAGNKSLYKFVKIPREHNLLADALAKKARCDNSNYVVTWKT